MGKKIILLICAQLLLFGCEAKASKQLYEAGVYTGVAEGYGGPVSVEVETDISHIRSIKILKHEETSVLSSPAFERIPAEILKGQHPGVDAVAGCTITSNAIVLAVCDALAKSGADMSSLSPSWAEDAPAMAQTLTYQADVVIIGAGGAGLTAGVEALRSGASVIMLEKLAAPGGNTLFGASSFPRPGALGQYNLKMNQNERSAIAALLELVPRDNTMRQWQSDLKREYELYTGGQTDGHLFDSQSLFKLQVYVMSGYKADTGLLEAYAAGLSGGARFLEELGVVWKSGVYAGVGSGWRRSLVPADGWGATGAGFVMPQLSAVKALGGQVLYNMTAGEIIVDSGHVVGVRGSTDGASFEVRANKGVIIATGGYSANRDMINEKSIARANLESLPILGTSSVTGDGIVMGLGVGADYVDGGQIVLYPFYSDGMATSVMDGLILLGSEGSRFIREDASQEVLSEAMLSVGGRAWIVGDAGSIYGRGLSSLLSRGLLLRGETIEELASVMQLPAEAIEEAVLQYNRGASGKTEPFGRVVFGQIFEKPPFYAYSVSLAVRGGTGGLKIDAQARVLDSAGQPIPGLWAAGEVTGGLSGITGANALVFGRIAGRSAAAQN